MAVQPLHRSHVEPKVAPPNDTPVYSSDDLGPLNNTKKLEPPTLKEKIKPWYRAFFEKARLLLEGP
jgi:hypothetical protein